MMRSLLTLALAVVSTFGFFKAGSRAADPGVGEWTTFGNGPSHSGYYPKTIGGGTFTASWSKIFPTQVNPPTVSGTTIYLTTNGYFNAGMRAFALSATDGQELWSHPLADAYSVNPPTFWNGRVYFQRGNSSYDTQLWCLNASDGALLWAAPFDAQWERYLAPAVVEEGAFINGGAYGGLYGFDSTTGTRRFFVNRAQRDGWTPSYSGGVVYSCVYGSFLATSASTGSQQWIADLTQSTTGTDTYWTDGNVPAISGSTAAVIGGGRIVAMNLGTHAPAWFKAGIYTGTPAVAGGVIYAISGSAVQAYRTTDGTSVGTYTAGSPLAGQPIVAEDTLIAASLTNTYIFDRSTLQLRQTLPTGGPLSYAAGILYVVGTTSTYPYTSVVATYRVTPTEADPPASTVSTPPATPQPHPNPARTLKTTSVQWLDCQRVGGMAYFLFDNPAKLERFDLNASQWLPPISLPDGPKAFTASQAGIFVSFGNTISRFPLDGSTETPMGVTVDDERRVIEIADKLYLIDSTGSKFVVMDATTGALIQAKSFSSGGTGFTASPTKRKMFARSVGYTPSDILQFTLSADGLLSSQSDSPYHGAYPDATRTYLFPGEGRVTDNSGIIYSTGDLSYLASLAGAFDDLDFAGDAPIVLRGNKLVAYSNGLSETGRATLAGAASRIFVAGADVVSFTFATGRGVAEGKTPLSQLVPPSPGTSIDPNGLRYSPDAIELGNGDVIYLLSKATQSIFRWSIPLRKYLSTIPLAEVPQLMAYSSAQNRIYLSYSGGRITKIELDSGFSEAGFSNTPLSAGGLATAGTYLFAEDPSGAWATHYVFSATGSLISSKDWNYYSREYIWSPINRKMYFFRDGTSPNDLIWEDIDLDGKLGQDVDSPYHGDYTVQHPLRVSPDGTQVVLGNGDLYAGVTLTRIGTLGINVADAAWAQSKLYTLGGTTASENSSEWPYLPIYSAGEIRAWDANRQQVGNVATDGQPLRMFATSDGLVTVSQVLGKARIGRRGFDLSLVSMDPQVTTPTVTTSAASLEDTVSAQLNGNVSPGDYQDARFEYGRTNGYGSRVDASIQAGSGDAIAALNNLSAATTYHFRLVVTGLDGPITGGDVVVQTKAYPSVTTGAASAVTLTSARLNGTIPTGSGYVGAHFEWGTDTLYGHTTEAVSQSAADGFDSLSASVSGLVAGATYHFRLVATFPAGPIFGGDRTFGATAGSRDLVYLVSDDAPRPIVLPLLAGFDSLKAKATAVSHPALGDVFPGPGGTLVYLPRIAFREFTGTDSFIYAVNSGDGGTVGGRVTFINPFHRARGVFSGTFVGGVLSAMITSDGNVTGRVRINGVALRFSERFDGNARFETLLDSDQTGPVLLKCGLAYSNGQFTLVGTVGGSSLTLYQTAAPALVSWHSGRYTLLVPPDAGNPSNAIPQGVGFALMTVSPGGAAKIAGRLADGRAFSGGGPIRATGNGDGIPFYSVLNYPNAGSVFGTLLFADNALSDCTGTFTWQKPPQRGGRFSSGFDTTCLVGGSRYAPPGSNLPPLALADASPNARFRAGRGSLAQDLDQEFTVTRHADVISTGSNPNQIVLSIDSRSGLMTGRFIHPLNRDPVTFRGVICTKRNYAAGFFLGPTESGWVGFFHN